MMSALMKHDSIWLTEKEHEAGGCFWCEDKITDDDLKYLLSTPAREFASELLEALKTARMYAEFTPEHGQIIDDIIAKAQGAERHDAERIGIKAAATFAGMAKLGGGVFTAEDFGNSSRDTE